MFFSDWILSYIDFSAFSSPLLPTNACIIVPVTKRVSSGDGIYGSFEEAGSLGLVHFKDPFKRLVHFYIYSLLRRQPGVYSLYPVNNHSED